MQMRTRYRLRWWLVYWWLAGCVLVNIIALNHGPLINTIVFLLIPSMLFLLGGACALWIVLLFVGKPDWGVWLTRRQYVLCPLALCFFGLSPALFIYGGNAWAIEQTIQSIRARYGVEVNILGGGPGWYNDNGEWGPGLSRTLVVRTMVKTSNPEQFVLELKADLEKHGWKEQAIVSAVNYKVYCSNMTISRILSRGLILESTNFIHVSLSKSSELESADQADISFLFDAVNPFGSQCRL